MKTKLGSPPRWILQGAILGTLSWLAVSFFLFRVGPNIVTNTYLRAAGQIGSGISPYQDPRGFGDWYKYSPFFAFGYQGLAALPARLHVEVWALFNSLMFWLGASKWFDLRRGISPLIWLGALFASMELDGSLRYQQINAALAGSILLGVAFYREGRYLAAGFLLALGAEIKILPALFILPLLWPLSFRFYGGLLLGFGLPVLIPLPFWGVNRTYELHLEWLSLLLKDSATSGMLDIETLFNRSGFPFGKLVRTGILLITLAGLFLFRKIPSPRSLWPAGLALGLGGLLLVSPRTESPTFVLAGAAYLLLFIEISKMKKNRAPWLILAAAAVFLISILYNDVWPRPWHPNHFYWKGWGALPLWFLALGLGIRSRIVKENSPG